LNSENNLLASLNLWEITVHDDGLHVSNLSAECHGGIRRRRRRRSVEVKFELSGAGEEVLAEVGAFEQGEARAVIGGEDEGHDFFEVHPHALEIGEGEA
jgi:hypothetical protein